MPSNRKPKVQEDAPSASLVSMLSLLHERCPVLCPSVIPSGLADGEHGVALLALCEDVAEKQALASLLRDTEGTLQEHLAAEQSLGLSPEQFREFKEVFDNFDKDGSGTISLDELREGLKLNASEAASAELDANTNRMHDRLAFAY